MSYLDWAEVTDDLSSALGLLGDRGFVVLGEPVPGSARRRTLFRRRTLPAPARYVQVLRVDGVLTAECVGAASLGGTWEMSRSTVDRLRRLGWRTPGELALAGHHQVTAPPTPNFVVHVESAEDAEPTELVDLLVTSLRVLGAEPDGLVLTGGP